MFRSAVMLRDYPLQLRMLPALECGVRPSMQTVIDCKDSVKAYTNGFRKVLALASRDCACGGRLKGHGRRFRWVACLEGILRVPIQRLVCRACGKTVSLMPRILYAFTQCARGLADRIRSLWDGGRHAMSDVRYMLSSRCRGLRLALPSMYRWARLPCLRACGPHAQAGGSLIGHTT